MFYDFALLSWYFICLLIVLPDKKVNGSFALFYRDTKLLVDAYIKALSTENPDVALSAAHFIPQIILLADGNIYISY